jgi:TonB-dependent starch-binding outer membrane protein SusC
MEMTQQPRGGANPAGRGERHPRRLGSGVLLAVLALLLAYAIPAEAQHRISGRVTSATTNEGLSGVQVQIRGTTVGTLTDADGRYAVTAPSTEGTIAFVRIGYASQEAPIAGRSVIDVILAEAATEIEGIVVVGYGEKARVNLTESIGVVTGQEIQQVAVASADQAIQGRVTGAQIISQSGTPGAPVSVRIRGVGTIGNTQPLFVIDGVPAGRGATARTNPLATINPADIESISVLKDASAAAVYGVQAANGVVLITTRRGRIGKPTIQYDGYSGIQRMPRFYDLNNATEWHALWSEALDAGNRYFNRQPGTTDFALLPHRIRPQNWDAEQQAWVPNPDFEPELLQRNTDWQRIPLNQNAPIMNHNLSVSGATDDVNYYVSAGFFQQDAIQQKWDIDRVSFRANSDFRVTDRIRFGETFSISNQRTFRGHHQFGDGLILNSALQLPPIYLYRDPNPDPNNRYGFASNVGLLDAVSANMPAINHLKDVNERSTRILGGLHGEVDVLRGLTFRTQANLDYSVGRYYEFSEGWAMHEVGMDRNQPAAQENRSENYSVVLTNTLTFDNSFRGHNINLLAGIETQQNRWDQIEMRRTEFLSFDPAIRSIVGGAGAIPHSAWAGENAFLGYLGRLSYNYDDRYLLTASVRRDGASEFAPDYRWGTFPSVSAAWRISQEDFFNVPWINELKLRGSWGRLGNSSIQGGAYPHLLPVAPQSTYVLGGTRSPQEASDVPIPLPRFPNPALTWEETTTSDFGIEAGFLNDRVDLAATYYRKNTGGFLLNVDLPPSSGFLRSPFNSGLVTNRGVELEVGYSPPQFVSGLDLRVSGNLTTVRNRLESLAPEIEEFTPPGDGGVQTWAQHYRTAPGFPVGYFYGYQTCGIFRTDEAAAQAAMDRTIDGRRPQAGDMCFVDVTGDGEITTADRTFLGSSIPDAYYGLNLSANYRRFDLTAFFNGVQGVTLYNQLRRNLEHMGGGNSNQMRTTQDRWTPQNPNASMPRAISGDPAGNNRFSDRWLEDGSYFRLRTLQLGFTLPDRFMGTNNTRIYVNAQNLFTITGYSGFDPEFTTTIDHWRSRNDLALFQGTDRGDIPQPRMFQIGLSTSF